METPRRPKILILTAAYGEGHNAAARALHLALQQQHPEVESQLLDPLGEAYHTAYKATRSSYLEMIEKRPRWWGGVYALLDRTPAIWAMPYILPAGRYFIRQLIEREQPVAIISTYPLYAYMVQVLYPHAAQRTFRLYTIVTDSLTINSVWHRATSDTFLLPNEATAEVMRRQGVPPEKLKVSGFPVPPVFAQQRPERPDPQGGAGRVLYMINAGRSQAVGMVEALLAVPGIELTVTIGRDETLRPEIQAVADRLGRSVHILGWVSNMPELVMSHHLLIGKAGGAAVQEALAAVTPMIITKVLPGQEEGNARLLLQYGCAAVCPDAPAVGAQVAELFAHDAALWKTWRDRMAAVSNPASALQLAQWVVQQTATPAA